MTGPVKGVLDLIRNVAPSAKGRHCCLHREALAVKKMLCELKVMLYEGDNVVNFIKARPLHSRLRTRTALFQETRSIYIVLLLHTELLWLSQGKILSYVYEMKDKIRIFLTGNNYFSL